MIDSNLNESKQDPEKDSKEEPRGNASLLTDLGSGFQNLSDPKTFIAALSLLGTPFLVSVIGLPLPTAVVSGIVIFLAYLTWVGADKEQRSLRRVARVGIPVLLLAAAFTTYYAPFVGKTKASDNESRQTSKDPNPRSNSLSPQSKAELADSSPKASTDISKRTTDAPKSPKSAPRSAAVNQKNSNTVGADPAPATKALEPQRSEPEWLPGWGVTQNSTGPNSPNIVGSGNTVTINPDVNPNAPVTTYDFNGWKRVVGGGRIDLQPAYLKEFEVLNEIYKRKDWKQLLESSEAQIKVSPEWLTPHLFAGVANVGLGNFAAARMRFNHVMSKAAGNPQFSGAERALKQLPPD